MFNSKLKQENAELQDALASLQKRYTNVVKLLDARQDEAVALQRELNTLKVTPPTYSITEEDIRSAVTQSMEELLSILKDGVKESLIEEIVDRLVESDDEDYDEEEEDSDDDED
jgi:hypothetical protein